jgi:hypothetical protein
MEMGEYSKTVHYAVCNMPEDDLTLVSSALSSVERQGLKVESEIWRTASFPFSMCNYFPS